MPINPRLFGKFKIPSCDPPDEPMQRKRMVPGLGYVLTPPLINYNTDSKEEKERKEKLLKKLRGRKAKLETLEKLFKKEL